MEIEAIKSLIVKLRFSQENERNQIYSKRYSNHKNYAISLNFENQKIDYGKKIKLEDETTSNFSQPENFVVLECVNRLLEKGYEPQHLILERKYPLGRTGKSGKSDISVFDREGKSLIIIECKTWGGEYNKEKNRMIENGGQLFSYLQQDKNTRFLCLYTSQLNDDEVIYENAIIQIKDREETLRLLVESKEEIKSYKEAKTTEELYEAWKENFNCYFAPNGIFDQEVQAYNPEYIPIKKKDLQPFSEGEGRKLFNQFEEILRHNNISDKSNAFNRILSLILCKIVDEQKKENDVTEFQIIEGKDTPEKIQERLQELYARGMKEFLKEEIVNYSEKDIDYWVSNFPNQIAQTEIKRILRELKFYSNNEFAFKEVHNEKLFLENAKVLNEIITLLQYKRFRYFYNDGNGLKYQKQYLGDFFEQLLDAGYKQSEGQFFSPLPIAKFIVKSIPLREIVQTKLKENQRYFLPYLIDYACGSGHFLVEAIEEIQYIIDDIKPKYTDKVNRTIRQYQESADWAEKFIYGIEKDYRLARTAKVACFMNGDGQANIFFGDGLEDYNETERRLAANYDVVIANPPYSIHGFKPHALKLKDKYDLFDYLTDSSSEIEALFIERTAQLLQTGGKAGIILPSSILNNTGIYGRAREIILQNFLIKAIVELGSNAFMATGTNTIVLFMEKRDSRWKQDYLFVAEDYIINNKSRENDFTDTEALLRRYVDYLALEFDDYKTFVSRDANETIKATEWYKDYRQWFDKSTDVKNLKKRRDFKALTQEEKDKRIERLFYDLVLEIEKEKFYYYLLSYDQEFIIIKSGNDIQSNREFLGYEFKKGRQAGMVVYRDNNDKDKTALYDEENQLNPEKVNYYIYQSFLGNLQTPSDAVKKYVSSVDLIDCIDFKRVEFEKQISLVYQTKIKIETKWNVYKIGKICETSSGGTPLSTILEYYQDGDIPWINSGEVKQGIITQTNNHITQLGLDNSSAKLFPVNTVLVAMYGATAGQVGILGIEATTNQAICGILPDDKILPKFLYFYLREQTSILLNLRTGKARLNISQDVIKNFPIPLPPKEVQEQIIQEIEVLENREQELKNNMLDCKNQIKSLIREIYNSNHSLKKLGTLCLNVQYGISQKMNTDSIGYKIFRMNEIIEGKMFDNENMKYVDISSEEFEKFKLYPGDILFNRTNSIELVGKTGIFDLVGDYCFASYLIRLQVDLEQANPFFINLIMNYAQFQEIAKGKATKSINQANINATKLKSIEIPVPLLSIQNNIANQVKNIETEIAKLESEINKIPQQKETILKKYL